MKKLQTIVFLIFFLSACQPSSNQTKEIAEEGISDKVALEEENIEIQPMELESQETKAVEPEPNTEQESGFEERTLGDLIISMEKEVVFEYIFHIMSITNKDGEKVDELRIVKMHSSSTGCAQEIAGEYNFTSDDEFQVVQNINELSCGAEIDDPSTAGVTEEQFLMIEDPYEIVTKETVSRETTTYKISEVGKIDKLDTAVELISESIFDLERFNGLPAEKLRLLRNHIFASYGYKFKSEDLSQHFAAKGWYEPKLDNVDDLLTENDKKIIAYLRNLEST